MDSTTSLNKNLKCAILVLTVPHVLCAFCVKKKKIINNNTFGLFCYVCSSVCLVGNTLTVREQNCSSRTESNLSRISCQATGAFDNLCFSILWDFSSLAHHIKRNFKSVIWNLQLLMQKYEFFFIHLLWNIFKAQ